MTAAENDVDVIWQGSRAGQVDVGSLTSELSLRDGEAIQLGVLDRFLAAGEARSGWKVGMTSGVGRDSFGVGVRPFGYILSSRTLASGATVDAAGISHVGLETELCFRLGARLGGGGADARAAKEAVEAVAPAFEINEERLDSTSDPAAKTADNLRHWGIVVAEMQPVPEQGFATMTSTILRDGVELQKVSAAGHIDDHFESLAALARELSGFGRALEAGDLVITGAFTRIGATEAGRYTGTFDGLGSVEVRLA